MKTENGKLKKYKLGEYIDSFGDGIHGTPNYDEKGEYYFINGNNLKDGQLNITEDTLKISSNEYSKIKRRLIPNNTILVSINGTLGNVALYKSENIALGKSACYLNLKDSSFRFFLRYLLKTKEFKNYMNRVAGQSTIKNVSPTQISEYEFFAPPLESQQKIAAVLSALDDKIALNNRMNAKLEQMAKRLYDYWFVQFDFPNADDKPYKSTGGKMVWNETLKREIPDGWEVKKISEILDCEIPGDWGEEEIKGNHKYKVNCIRGCDMVDMTDLPVRYILESNSKKLLQKDDFVIEISGGSPTQSTGRIVQITDEIIKRFNGKIICSNFCHGIRLNDKDYASYFFQMWNMFYLNNIFFNYEGKTSGLKNFQFDTFVSETWYVPPKELVRKYHEVVSKFRKQIDINESETQKLTVLRDRLLPLLMNGQVVVE